MEAVKSDQKAFGCANEAFLRENQALLVWREVSRYQTNHHWIVRKKSRVRVNSTAERPTLAPAVPMTGA